MEKEILLNLIIRRKLLSPPYYIPMNNYDKNQLYNILYVDKDIDNLSRLNKSELLIIYKLYREKKSELIKSVRNKYPTYKKLFPGLAKMSKKDILSLVAKHGKKLGFPTPTTIVVKPAVKVAPIPVAAQGPPPLPARDYKGLMSYTLDKFIASKRDRQLDMLEFYNNLDSAEFFTILTNKVLGDDNDYRVYIIKVNGRYYTINSNTVTKLQNAIEKHNKDKVFGGFSGGSSDRKNRGDENQKSDDELIDMMIEGITSFLLLKREMRDKMYHNIVTDAGSDYRIVDFVLNTSYGLDDLYDNDEISMEEYDLIKQLRIKYAAYIKDDKTMSRAQLFKKYGRVSKKNLKGKRKNNGKRESGAFFNMYNTSEIDLYRYGIYKKEDICSYDENCLINSLEVMGCDRTVINELKTMCRNNVIPKKCLSVICSKYNIEIHVKSDRNTNKSVYGKTDDDSRVFQLGIVNKHYFPNELYKITAYALEHYKGLMVKFGYVNKFNNIDKIQKKNGKNYYHRYNENSKSDNKFLTSYDVIKYMFEHKDRFFEKMENTFEVLSTYQKSHIDNYITDLSFIPYKKGKPGKNGERGEEDQGSVRPFKSMFDVKYVGKDKNGKDMFSSTYEKRLGEVLNYNIVHADFETLIDYSDPNNIQVTDMIAKIEESSFFEDVLEYSIFEGVEQKVTRKVPAYHKEVFVGSDCGKQFLDSLHGDSIVIFHNASYDNAFIQKYLQRDTLIKSSAKKLTEGRYIYVYDEEQYKIHCPDCDSDTGFRNIIIKDSYAMISVPLSKFGPMFHLDVNKADISHDYYNDLNKKGLLFGNMDDKHVSMQSINDLKVFVNNDKMFLAICKNVEDWGLYNDDKTMFDAYGYRMKYCMMDVEVQMKGYNKFRENIKTICNMEALVFPTLASLADSYMAKKGCYKNTYELSGIPREFIQKCIVGGRTMTGGNKKYNISKDSNGKPIKISDFDAVSLYPSAMKSLKGLITGPPKIIPDEYISDPSKNASIMKYNEFFVEIIINHVGVNREMPLMSYIDDNGLRVWTNDMVGKTMYVDKNSLKDLFAYHKVRCTIVKGYYFDGEYNNNICRVIKEIFLERQKAQAAKNPIQAIYKLLMNSAYGKTLLKPIETEYKVMHKDEFEDYLHMNFEQIKTFRDVYGCDKIEVEVNKSIISHFNRCHLGCQILSESKSIMNSVICTAEDIGIKIYYQDTDSMHIAESNIPNLQKEYKKRYGKELIGKNMGQFHSDFELSGAPNCSNINSVHLVALGKKSYCDKLVAEWDEHTNDNGDIIPAGECVGYHIRMKGIPTSSIMHKCKVLGVTPIELYEKMYNGEEMVFDLTCGKSKSILKYNNNMTYSTIEEGKGTLKKVQF